MSHAGSRGRQEAYLGGRHVDGMNGEQRGIQQSEIVKALDRAFSR